MIMFKAAAVVAAAELSLLRTIAATIAIGFCV